MIKWFKSFSLVLKTLFFLLLISFQLSFLNYLNISFDLILIFIIFLAITQSNAETLVCAWLSGVFVGTSYLSGSGMLSLLLLFIALFLIMIRKTAFFTLKIENIILLSIIAVFLQRFLIWAFFGVSPITNWVGFITELTITPLILVLIFNSSKNQTLKRINV